MKFLNWNVNGLRAVMNKGLLMPFIMEEDPDIISFEETKMQEDQMTFSFDGYLRYMNCAEKKGYSGTMVLTKKEPLSVSYDIEGDDHPLEGRVITLEYEDFYYVCAYVPNSKDGLLRLDYRMHWEDDLRKHLLKLDGKKPVIYTGDLNVAHNEIDLKNPDENHFSAGFSDEEREKFTVLLDSGFKDTYRELYPENVQYSWWSYRTKARERGVGWRIDYYVVSERLMDKVKDSIIYDQVMGSDHCPVGLILQGESWK
ncbi:MAG: exodeoxyribonuclease III [Erysipelotrichaceae bacterium]|nr:exodeoxyribonuclease III [Erysipelotrichaceae bacterium]